MWPPSDPEIMSSASSDKAEITYCSVWAAAIVSASGMTEGSKENPSIWYSSSPYPSTSLCFYILISRQAFPPSFCRPSLCTFLLVLGAVLQCLFSNALRNYFLFFYKQTQKSSGQPRRAGSTQALSHSWAEAAASEIGGTETP